MEASQSEQNGFRPQLLLLFLIILVTYAYSESWWMEPDALNANQQILSNDGQTSSLSGSSLRIQPPEELQTNSLQMQIKKNGSIQKFNDSKQEITTTLIPKHNDPTASPTQHPTRSPLKLSPDEFLDQFYGTINLTEFTLKYIQSNESWSKYRIGDMFRHTNDEKGGNGSSAYPYHKENFPDSIATKYMEQSGFTPYNHSVMMQIVNNKTRKMMENEQGFHEIMQEINETIIMHLRTGDVIDRSPFSAYEILSGHYLPHSDVRNQKFQLGTFEQMKKKQRPLVFYEKILKDLKKQHIKNRNIIMITGFHKEDNHSRSIDYIASVAKYLEFQSYSVSIRINKSPDVDFVLMCNAKYFVQGNGGFSSVIADMVRLRGGKVFK